MRACRHTVNKVLTVMRRMRNSGLALVLLLIAQGAAIAGEPGDLQRLTAVSSTKDHEMSLAPGALGTVALKGPARSVTVKDGAVATGYIAGDVVAVITARSPGRTTVDIRDRNGDMVESIELNVKRASNSAGAALPLGPGPTFPHTPSRQDLLALMGPRFTLEAAAPRHVAMPAAVQPLETGDRVRPPVGWNQFCNFYPEECSGPELVAETAALSPRKWQQLVAINSAVNHRIKPVSDMDHHGIVEHWDYPMDGLGDCEDYALLKRRLLIEAGWPRQSLLMTVVRDQGGDGHAILSVATDQGDFILDNQVDDILSWVDTGYRFVKRQSAESPNIWVSLNNIDSAVVAFSATGPHNEH